MLAGDVAPVLSEFALESCWNDNLDFNCSAIALYSQRQASRQAQSRGTGMNDIAIELLKNQE